MAQPQVSKHLRVLREVDLVHVRDEGRQRLYRLNAEPLQSIHDWLRKYQERWTSRFDALDTVLTELTQEENHGD
jgi:DNA-binding transcriptional ArsR family regulator